MFNDFKLAFDDFVEKIQSMIKERLSLKDYILESLNK